MIKKTAIRTTPEEQKVQENSRIAGNKKGAQISTSTQQTLCDSVTMTHALNQRKVVETGKRHPDWGHMGLTHLYSPTHPIDSPIRVRCFLDARAGQKTQKAHRETVVVE